MDAYTRLSSAVAERIDVLSERVIFWGLVSTSIVISTAILKDMLGVYSLIYPSVWLSK
jgi:hypothetical protein